MGWTVTNDVERYLAAAGGFLRADPVENTVPLGVVEALRIRGVTTAGPGELFGWWETDGDVRGALLLSAGFPLLLSAMPDALAAELADVLADREVVLSGVTAQPSAAGAFADGWRRTGLAARLQMRQRLFRLGRLCRPSAPDGRARVATAADRALVHAWFTAFEDEAGGAGRVDEAAIDDRIGYGGVLLWEVGGEAVALAGRTRVAADMVRIGPVYTPPAHRRRGYGAAVTATLSRDAGAEHVVLFTDLANPTSNGLYRRLGYEAVSDRLLLRFG
jgi:ribosomal protein S18 acetylase RimI-like enzyme